MRTPRLFLGIFALALRLPLLLLACGGSGELTDGWAILGTGHRRAHNGSRRTVAHAQGYRQTPAGADLARNGPGSAGRPL